MEHSFSVDDFVGVWGKLGGGFSRTDSEAAFQDFLKRIPSTTNLAGQAQSLDPAQQLQLQQHVAQLQHLHGGDVATSSSMSDGPGILAGRSGSLGGIPRVPSLDLIRQMLGNHQHVSRPLVTIDPLGSLPLGSLRMHGQSLEASTALPSYPLLTTLPVSTPLPILASVSTTAVAPVLKTQSQPSRSASEAGDEAVPPEVLVKAEVRRARRMLSNRESARRSRRRKQEHLSVLEDQMNEVVREKEEVVRQMEEVEAELDSKCAENKALRTENEYLKEKIARLSGEACGILGRSGSLQRAGSLDQGSKRKREGEYVLPKAPELKYENGQKHRTANGVLHR